MALFWILYCADTFPFFKPFPLACFIFAFSLDSCFWFRLFMRSNLISMHSCASSSVLYNAKTTSDVKIVDDVDISVDISVDNAADNAFEKRSVLSYLSFSCSSCCRCYLEILLWKHRYTLILIRVPRHRN